MSWSHNSDWKKSVCKQNPLSSTLSANGFVESERTKEQKVEMLFFPLLIHFLVSLNLLWCLTQKQGWDSILGWLQDSVFFTWNGIQETHTPSRFSRNREAENMKSNSGQNSTHLSQTDEIHVASSVGPGGSHPRVLKELKDEIGKLLSKMPGATLPSSHC